LVGCGAVTCACELNRVAVVMASRFSAWTKSVRGNREEEEVEGGVAWVFLSSHH
jgi:hypothetical protein